MNGTLVKNQLILDFASGSLGISKSILVSSYLYLNSKANKINSTFENLLGENLLNINNEPLSKLKYTDCLSNTSEKANKNDISPISKLVGPFEQLEWKNVYKGFSEYTADIDDKDDWNNDENDW